MCFIFPLVAKYTFIALYKTEAIGDKSNKRTATLIPDNLHSPNTNKEMTRKAVQTKYTI